MRNPVKTIRRVVQLLFLAGFLYLFWEARWHGVDELAPPPLFLRMDPLVALTSWLAPTPNWLPLAFPALAVLVVTLLLGRVFCGWVCPLGTTIDVFDHVLFRRRTRRPAHLNRPAWKYYVLGAVLISAVFGAQLAWMMDPIPLLTRTCAVVAYPVVVAAHNLGVTTGRPVLAAFGLRPAPMASPPTFALNLVVLAVFVGIIGLSLVSRRYWCRTLCPLGALLAFVGRFGLVKRRVTGCVKCRRCVGECKMGAVPEAGEEGDFRRTMTAECIQCYDCLVCPQEGIAAVGFYGKVEGARRETQASRRHFIASVGLGALYGMTAVTGAGRRATHPRLIRPPGAIIRTATGIRTMTEKEFRDLCVRCGACMKACVTRGLQPAVVEAGFDGLFTPILVPKIGHCEQSCTACGQVCPTGALGRFEVREKDDIRIGLATVHRDKCLSCQPGDLYKLCLVCDEFCPYKAIELIEDAYGHKNPVVNRDVCTGCGQCERFCPIKPEAAIVVYRTDVGV